jgi:hypothetical protein
MQSVMLGLKQVGSRHDAPYDRVTGASFVAACNGQYADALSKGVGVSLLVAETTGALAASFMTILPLLLARQTRPPAASSRTTLPTSPPPSKPPTPKPSSTPPARECSVSHMWGHVRCVYSERAVTVP